MYLRRNVGVTFGCPISGRTLGRGIQLQRSISSGIGKYHEMKVPRDSILFVCLCKYIDTRTQQAIQLHSLLRKITGIMVCVFFVNQQFVKFPLERLIGVNDT